MNQIVLINLGGPRTPEEIYPFLDDLFSDPYVFDLPLPEFFRIRLAKFIAKRRAPKVRHAYESMGYGGGSPLYEETIKQGRGLAEILQNLSGKEWNFKIANTCGYPNIRSLSIKDLTPSPNNVIVPLFPHFSRSTTMSANKLMESLLGFCPSTSSKSPCHTGCQNFCKSSSSQITGWVSPFFDDPEYVRASSNLILDFFQGKLETKNFLKLEGQKIENWENVPILFSAHGIPMRLVKKGDTYPSQIETGKQLIESQLNISGYKAKTFLSYQSKVGPAKWTEPSTIQKIQELGKQGIKRLAICPISFVSDHLETLEEIGEQLKEVAHASGISEYYRIPAHGIYPEFLKFLAKKILSVTK